MLMIIVKETLIKAFPPQDLQIDVTPEPGVSGIDT